MKKFFLCLFLLALLGTYSAKAKQFVGQLILNYQDNSSDAIIPYALVTHKEIIPLNFHDISKVRRSLVRFSGDVVKVEGDLEKSEIVERPSLVDTIPPEARDFIDMNSSTSVVVKGIDVVQIGFPIREMTFSGEIKARYVPEVKESVFDVEDRAGLIRTVLLPKYIHDEFLSNYYGKDVEVTVRVIRINNIEVLFANRIKVR